MIDVVLPSQTFFCGLPYPGGGWAPHPDMCWSLELSKPLAGGCCQQSQAGEPCHISQASATTANPPSSPQNFPNQTRQTFLKPLSILINITEQEVSETMQGSDQNLSDLSSLKAGHKTIQLPTDASVLLCRYLTPALLTCMTSHFSKACFGFEMPSLFLLKSIFTTENGFLMSFVPQFICYKGKIFQAAWLTLRKYWA